MYDNQNLAEIKIVEGESSIAEENYSLSSFTIPVPEGPAGAAQIKVKLKINKNGTIEVSAKESGTDWKTVTIKSEARMSHEEIEEAEDNIGDLIGDDKERERELNILNDAEEAVFKANNYINKYEEKILYGDLDALNNNINEIEKLLEDSEEDDFDDFDAIEFYTQELLKVLNEIEGYI